MCMALSSLPRLHGVFVLRCFSLGFICPLAGCKAPGTKEPNVDKLVRPGKRLIKSHLEPKLFQKAFPATRTEFMICVRNIKDKLVSHHNF